MARWGNRYDANRTLVQIVHRRCRIVAGHAPKLIHIQALDHVDERGDRVGLHLPRDLPSVDLDRFLGRAELGGDLPVGQPAAHDEPPHLPLAGGQPRQPPLDGLALGLRQRTPAAEGERIPNTCEQHLVANGFLQDIKGARFQAWTLGRTLRAPVMKMLGIVYWCSASWTRRSRPPGPVPRCRSSTRQDG